MEDPATWGAAEKVIARAIHIHNNARKQGVVGLSLVRCIADALREAGLLMEPVERPQPRPFTEEEVAKVVNTQEGGQ